MFLDEPTANLDPEAAKTVRDFILELKKEKRTIFLNTHNLDEAERLCDRIAILNTKLIAVDSLKNLEPSLYNRKTIVHLDRLSDAVLTAVTGIGKVKSVRTLDNKLILIIDDPEKDSPEVVRAIVEAGGNIQYVTELRSTFEDVYLKLIRRLRVNEILEIMDRDPKRSKLHQEKQICFLLFNCHANNSWHYSLRDFCVCVECRSIGASP